MRRYRSNTMRRQSVLGLLAVCLVLSGCTAPTGVASKPDSTGDQAPRKPFPDPPANLSTDTVRTVAIEYDRARVHNLLRNVSEITTFDIGYLSSPSATVVNHTEHGVYVRTEIRYSYATDAKHADGVPVRSLYYLNTTTIHLVDVQYAPESYADG